MNNRISKKLMRNFVAWAIKWAIVKEEDNIPVRLGRDDLKPEQCEEITRETLSKQLKGSWPGIKSINAKDNTVECCLSNDQRFLIKIIIPHARD